MRGKGVRTVLDNMKWASDKTSHYTQLGVEYKLYKNTTEKKDAKKGGS